jgi:penicillin-binding protein 1A
VDTIERDAPLPSESDDDLSGSSQAEAAAQVDATAASLPGDSARSDVPAESEAHRARITAPMQAEETPVGHDGHDGPRTDSGAEMVSHLPALDGHDQGYPNGHANGHRDGHADEQDTVAVIAGGPPMTYSDRAQGAARTRLAAARARRRRRRYTHYVVRSARARQQQRAQTWSRALWSGAIVLCALIAAVLTSTVSAAASYYQSQSPVLNSLNRKIAAQDSVRIFDSRGTLLYQLNDFGAQHSVPLAHIPVTIINATIAVEDKDFWINQGVDFQAIARAAFANVTAGHIESGASTITQQLIKQNVLSSDPTFARKIEEAILALGMTTQGTYTKRQILEMYLNSIPYGPVSYGIDAAASRYFSYSDDPATGITAAQHLDLAQASILAGIPQSPNTNNPLAGADGFSHARQRQHLVLADMVTQGYITQAQADAAWQEAGQPNFFHPQVDENNLAPHFVEYVKQILSDMVTAGQLHNVSRTGLNVYTTLDLDLQNYAQQAILNHLCGNDLNDYPGSPYRYIRDDNVTNAAAVLVDHHTGAIKVLLGSADYYGNRSCHKIDGMFDVATQGYRGPGSSFKPLVYATAFEKGYFPALTISNTPTVFWDAGAEKVYKPLNADTHLFIQNMTLRQALQMSLNIPAVKVMQFAGVDDVQRNAERMGIRDWRGTWGLSSVLGTLNVRLIDLVQAYTVFANYGQYIPEHAIDRITDTAGDVLFEYHNPQPVQVLSPQVAFLISNVLSDNPARAREFGTCSVLYLDPSTDDCYYWHGNSPNAWPAAAKTGTGQDLTDDWAMGYTMDYTMGVWVGNDDYSNMNWVDGVTGAAPIFYHTMLYAEKNLPKTPFPVPAGVHRATYSSYGITTTDWFIDGPAPDNNIGNTGPGYVCIRLYDNGPNPWDYC